VNTMSQISTRSRQTNLSYASESGQTMPEYGVVLTVITVGIVTSLTVFSGAIERAILRVVTLIP
jgi:Flp pilus assembly pilin Flp